MVRGWTPSARQVALAMLLVLLAAACGAGSGPAAPASIPGYRVLRDVPLPGGTQRWEYQVLDGSGHRLYLAHSGADGLVAVDTERHQVAATLSDVESTQGLVLAAELGRLYVSAPAAGQVAVIDLPSLHLVDRVSAGARPEGIAYAAGTGRVFVSNTRGPGDTVIDTVTNMRLADIDLGGGSVGQSQYDPWSGLVLVTVQDRHQLAAVDPRSLQVTSRIDLPGCDQPDGIQVDAAAQDRVFVACEANARLLTVDPAAGRVVGSIEVGWMPDVLALDPATHRLYVGADSGVLTVIDTGQDVPRALVRGYAGPEAHSVAVDPDTHVVYLPLAGLNGTSVLRELAPA